MVATRAIIDSMRLRLDASFITQPKAVLIVKRVEKFREKSAGKVFNNLIEYLVKWIANACLTSFW